MAEHIDFTDPNHELPFLNASNPQAAILCQRVIDQVQHKLKVSVDAYKAAAEAVDMSLDEFLEQEDCARIAGMLTGIQLVARFTIDCLMHELTGLEAAANEFGQN